MYKMTDCQTSWTSQIQSHGVTGATKNLIDRLVERLPSLRVLVIAVGVSWAEDLDESFKPREVEEARGDILWWRVSRSSGSHSCEHISSMEGQKLRSQVLRL